MAEDVELEQAEHGPIGDALQPVGAAGEPGRLVGDLAEHESDAERDHQPGQVGAAQDEEARGEAEKRRALPRRPTSPRSGSPATCFARSPAM